MALGLIKSLLLSSLLVLQLTRGNPVPDLNESLTLDSSDAMLTSNDSDEMPMDKLEDIVELPGTMESTPERGSESAMRDCSILSPEIREEIQSYQSTVDSIIQYVVHGQHKGLTHQTLGKFVDKFGSRMSGGEALESSINATMEAAQQEGFDVHTEDVKVPHWVRNEESATMLEPRVKKLSMLGLGSSVGTPPEGVVAQIVVVTSFDELEEVAEQVPGKIVVYNQPFTHYRESVQYRAFGAVEAARHGAVATLIRSVASFSINSPHTGGQRYNESVPKIPAACITVEDANLLHRLYQQGEKVVVNLTMGATTLPDATSRNLIIDTKGATSPQDLVVISGHVDSWDVGAGSMDDAGGCYISYHANLVLKRLGLSARRTVRTIWFTGEEQGLFGGNEYFMRHRNESDNYQLLLESDKGTFDPKGIAFSGSGTATCIMEEIVKLTAAINTTELKTPGGGPDISKWPSVGVPIGSLHLDTSKYFWFHHSEGDTFEVEDPDTLDRITALWASVAYVAADISANLQQ